MSMLRLFICPNCGADLLKDPHSHTIREPIIIAGVEVGAKFSRRCDRRNDGHVQMPELRR